MSGLASRILAEGKTKRPSPFKGQGEGMDVAQAGLWQCLMMPAGFSTTSILCQAGPVPLTASPTETWKNTQELHHHLPLAS